MMRNRYPTVSVRGRTLSFLLVIAALACVSGCASYQLRTPHSDPQIETYERQAPDAFFWGLIMSPQVMSADCSGGGFNDVIIQRNFLQDLVSVLTLGIWMPATVEYRCRVPQDPGGEFPKAPTQPGSQS